MLSLLKNIFHKATFVTLLAILNFGFSQNGLIVTNSDNTYHFKGESYLRYFADYQRGVLLIPEANLIEPLQKTKRITSVEETDLGLALKIRGDFRVSLSPNEKTLTLVLGESLGTVGQRLIEGDERSPVMYYLANAEPNLVATLLSNFYEELKVEIDDRQRALLVMVNPKDRKLIDSLIQALDRPRPQVMFEAEILEINQDITQSLGINYDSIFKFNVNEQEVPAIDQLGNFIRNPLGISFSINLLKTNGAANVLARPRVTTLDGVEAQINATQTVPVIVPSDKGTEGIQNITTGITLRMTPKITPTGHVEADLSITVSTPTGTTSQGVPQFSSRDASTRVRVANGEPIAIGGLIEKRRIEGTTKVPFLGDIPILGYLFRSTRIEERETDLVIIVTPRIIDMPELITVPELIPQAFSE